jgi:hypothetical protein
MKKQEAGSKLSAACCLLGLFFGLQDEGNMFPCNKGELLLDYMASYLKQQYSSESKLNFKDLPSATDPTK